MGFEPFCSSRRRVHQERPHGALEKLENIHQLIIRILLGLEKALWRDEKITSTLYSSPSGFYDENKKKNSAMLIYYYITHSQPTAAPNTMKHKNKRTNKQTNKAKKKKERNRTDQNNSIKKQKTKQPSVFSIPKE